MKRCPTCRRAFDDDTLTVCPDDGSALAGASDAPATQSDSGLGGNATWNPSQDQLAEIQQAVAATTTTPRSRKTPWLVAAPGNSYSAWRRVVDCVCRAEAVSQYRIV